MYIELKKAILDWMIENQKIWNRVNACTEHFSQYIYSTDGNYIIGGRIVSDFIRNADKLLSEV